MNAIGFTSGCDLPTMQSLASAGDAGVGLFYYLKHVDDIEAAIGDCLGSMLSIAVTDVRLTLLTPGFRFLGADRDADVAAADGFKAALGSLAFGARHAFVIVADDAAVDADAVRSANRPPPLLASASRISSSEARARSTCATQCASASTPLVALGVTSCSPALAIAPPSSSSLLLLLLLLSSERRVAAARTKRSTRAAAPHGKYERQTRHES